MLWLKACPKCNGDLVLEKDQFGSYISCIQCGYCLTVAQEAVLVKTDRLQVAGKREKELAGSPRRAKTA